jgi:hypothetical protein
MQQETVTLIVAALGISGTLISGILGQRMSRNSEHEQWRRDNIRQECRELLGQLSVCLFALIDWTRSVRFPNQKDSGKNAAIAQQYDSSVLDLHRNLGSRLLIANEIKKAQIKKRWKDAGEDYGKDYDEQKLNSVYEKLVDKIVEIGLNTYPLK